MSSPYTNRPEMLPTNSNDMWQQKYNAAVASWAFVALVAVGLGIGWRLEYLRCERIKKECAAQIEENYNNDWAEWSHFPTKTAEHPDGGSSETFIKWNFNKAVRGDDMRWDRVDHTWRERALYLETIKNRPADYQPQVSKYDCTSRGQREYAEYDRLSLEWEQQMREELQP